MQTPLALPFLPCRRLAAGSSLSATRQHELLQGLKKELEEQGCVFELISATAAEVRAFIIEGAKARYAAAMRRQKVFPIPAFDVKKVKNIPPLQTVDDHGQPVKYLVGWVLIPRYTLQGISHFQPVDAVDCAHFKAPAKGTLYARCTLDANRHIHPLTVGHLLCGECSWGYQRFFDVERRAYGSALNAPNRVTLVDGGTALNTELLKAYPLAHVFRCFRHLLPQLQAGGSKGENEEAIKTLRNIVFQPRCRLPDVSGPFHPSCAWQHACQIISVMTACHGLKDS